MDKALTIPNGTLRPGNDTFVEDGKDCCEDDENDVDDECFSMHMACDGPTPPIAIANSGVKYWRDPNR